MTNYDIDKELNIVRAVINALNDDVVSVKVKKSGMWFKLWVVKRKRDILNVNGVGKNIPALWVITEMFMMDGIKNMRCPNCNNPLLPETNTTTGTGNTWFCTTCKKHYCQEYYTMDRAGWLCMNKGWIKLWGGNGLLIKRGKKLLRIFFPIWNTKPFIVMPVSVK